MLCCILFVFYIKPQHTSNFRYYIIVVSYSCSTSNHNMTGVYSRNQLLYLIRVLHQTTTAGQNRIQRKRLYLIRVLHQTTTKQRGRGNVDGCILFVFYIKPQLGTECREADTVVSYSCSTSNHNYQPICPPPPMVVSYSCSTSNHNV